jgi:type IV pilus assembly protein PilE
MTVRKMRGFTLIEAMIVVAVLGLIVAMGYPSYQEQVRKSRRAEGMGELLELADRMERHYTDVGTYDHVDTLGVISDMKADVLYGTDTADDTVLTTNAHYKLSIDSGTDKIQFTARAEPQGKQTKDKCHTFVYNSNGQRTTTGGSLNAAQCNWQ